MNIMILTPCDLKCRYCFADDVIEGEKADRGTKFMSFEDFKYAVDFSADNGMNDVRIIGGEPMIHPEIRKFLEYAYNHPGINDVLLFTNGRHMDKLDGLWSKKLRILLNVNNEEACGLSEEKAKQSWELIKNNIRTIFSDYSKKDSVILGVNFYTPDYDYTEIVSLLEEIKYKSATKQHIRFSVAIPMDKSIDLLDYFREMKSPVFAFFRELDKIGLHANYDCNFMPVCITTTEEKTWLSSLKNKYGREFNLLNSPMCNPVIDVKPNLDVIRCFGMSEDFSVKLKDFKNIQEINGIFMKTTDSIACNIPMAEVCNTCKLFHTGGCTGGCLAFKLKKIKPMREVIEAASGAKLHGKS